MFAPKGNQVNVMQEENYNRLGVLKNQFLFESMLYRLQPHHTLMGIPPVPPAGDDYMKYLNHLPKHGAVYPDHRLLA